MLFNTIYTVINITLMSVFQLTNITQPVKVINVTLVHWAVKDS